MSREVTDEEKIVWSCVEAYSGLNDDAANREAARAASENGGVTVVCTPSGAARSVRLELRGDWDRAMTDEDLVAAIRAML